MFAVLRDEYSFCGGSLESPLQRAALRNDHSLAVTFQQLMRPFRQHPPDLAPFSPDPGDRHVVVARGLVPHPGDDRRFGPLLDGNPLRSGNSPAPDRSGVGGDRLGQLLCGGFIPVMKPEKGDYRTLKIFDVGRLDGFPSAGGGGLLFSICLSGSFCCQIELDLFNRGSGSPQTA